MRPCLVLILRLLLLGVLLFAGSLAWPLPEGAVERPVVASLLVTDRDGGALRTVRPDGHGLPVSLDEVAPAVVEALLATEDRRFRRHPGVDLPALARATWQNVRAGRIVSGGSTITMQVARTLHGAGARTLVVKLAEMHLALRLELHLSKREILTLWLERVPFGHRTYGVEAAAQLYFGKSARDLTTAEAAFLVGLPQSPSRYDPFRNPERARARHRRVLAAMERAGYLAAHERAHLETLPLALADPRPAFRAPHFVEHVLQRLPERHGIAELRTTLDPTLQQTVETLLRAHVSRLDAQGVTSTAAVVLDNASGEVLAYAGSADFWNARAGGQNDGVQMLRQPGSALKPFTYARALASGRYTPATILPDLPLQVLEAGGAFSPENYDRTYHGPVPLRTALASSYNVPAVRLVREMGPAALLETLHAAGFTSLDRPADHYGVGLTLGSGEVRLIELARAYAGLARGGLLPDVRMVGWVGTLIGDTLRFVATDGGSQLAADRDHACLAEQKRSRSSPLSPGGRETERGGDVSDQPLRRVQDLGDLPSPCPSPIKGEGASAQKYSRNVYGSYRDMDISPAVAYLLADVLGDPEARAPAFGRGGPLELPFPMAVKTGTSKDYRDNWAVGFTPRYTVAVWAGNFDGAPMRAVNGVSGAGPLLHAIALALGPGGTFVQPPGVVEAHYCPMSGLRPGLACPATRTGPFLAGTTPRDTCRVHRRVPVDRRTALRADADAPADQVDTTLFAVYPPEYHAWMREHGWPLPPPASRTARAVAASDDGTPRYDDRLRVDYPASGTTFQMDPVLRPAYQQLHLRGSANDDLHAVRWWIDDEPLSGDDLDATWTLHPGHHRIELRAVDGAGRTLRSRPSLITVTSSNYGGTKGTEDG